MLAEPVTVRLLGVLLGALATVTGAAWAGRSMAKGIDVRRLASAVLTRAGMWWAMCLVLLLAALVGSHGSVTVFAVTSFLLLREFITMTPTRRGDHRVLFWVFFVILPLQYYFLATGWYGMFSIAIPVYAFLLIPIRAALAGDTERFLERTAKIQWGLMICVYCVSHAPALLRLDVPGHPGAGLRLLVFLTAVVQVADLARQLSGSGHGPENAKTQTASRLALRHVGMGLAGAVLTGLLLSWAVPFDRAQAAGMALLAGFAGCGGSLCMERIQRDRGRKGVVVAQTSPTMIERVIPLCFAAPIFFHLTRYFFLGRPPAGF